MGDSGGGQERGPHLSRHLLTDMTRRGPQENNHNLQTLHPHGHHLPPHRSQTGKHHKHLIHSATASDPTASEGRADAEREGSDRGCSACLQPVHECYRTVS